MEFRKAKEELKKLANGEYHSITYELTEQDDGIQEVDCRLYIYPGITGAGSKWQEAFINLKKNMGIIEKVDTEEEPKE